MNTPTVQSLCAFGSVLDMEGGADVGREEEREGEGTGEEGRVRVRVKVRVMRSKVKELGRTSEGG